MASLATAWVDIVPRFSDLSSSFKKALGGIDATGTGTKIGEQMGDATVSAVEPKTLKLGGVFKSIGGLAAGVFAGISFANIVSGAVQASDATQKFASTLEFAGMGKDQIGQLTDSVQSYADKTVYDLSDIQNMTAQLASNGVPNFEQLAEAAGNLNAVAGGNADTFKSVGMVMTQTAGAGKLTTENWNQLSDAIPGASGKLQEAMQKNGAFTGNFRDAMAEGQITADEFNQAVMQLGMTDVAKQAASSTATFEGAWGNLQAAVQKGMAEIITKAMPLITTVMNGVTDAVGPAFDVINRGINFLVSAIQGSGLAQSFQAMFNVGDKASFLSQILASMQSILTGLGAAVMPLVSTVGGFIQNLTQAVLPPLMALIRNIMTIIQANMPAIQTAIANFTAYLTPLFDTVSKIAGMIVGQLVPPISNLISAILPVLLNIFNTLMPIITNVANTFMQGLIPVVQNVINIITGVIDIFQGLITFLTGVFSGNWDQAWQGIQQIFQGVWQVISNFFQGIWNAIQAWINTGLAYVQGLWQSAWAGVGGFFTSIWEGIKNAAQNGLNTVLGFFQGLHGQIGGFFAGAGQWLWNAGSAILNGLLDGLRSAWQGVTDFVGGIGQWIQDHKGPLSVDRVLLTPAGNAIMAGFAGGLTAGFKSDVMPAVNSVNNAMTGLFSGMDGSDINTRMNATATVNTRRTLSNADNVNGTAPLTRDELVSAVVEALQHLPDMNLRLNNGVMAAELAPAMASEFSTRQFRGL